MIKLEQIIAAQERITDLILDQCKNGTQSQDLSPNAACGQFIGKDAKERKQHGLHGTAAALRVLASSDTAESAAMIPKLVGYLQYRLNAVGGPDAESAQNVIKLGEILYALSFVKPAICQTEHLVRDIAEKLIKGMKVERGWGHFLDHTEDEVQLLPTAYAVRALSRTGYKTRIQTAVKYLTENLTSPFQTKVASRPVDSSVRILCLFVLSFDQTLLEKSQREKCRKIFLPLWEAHEALLKEDVEQNIEYWKGAYHYYVRVPWQLYFLALAVRLAPLRFAGVVAQKRLSSIVGSVNNGGFCYPHSGAMLSTRTNAIVYDTLELITNEQLSSPRYAFFYAIDWLKTALNSRWVTLFGYALGVFLAYLAIDEWIRERRNVSEVAPELFAAFIVWLMSWRAQK